MTGIPVVPGPWSWLGNAGQGIADVINARTQRDLREREEAKKHLAFIFEAVQKGALDVKALKSPAFLGALHKSGIGDAFTGNVIPNPEAQIKTGQSDMISHLLGGSPEIPDLAQAVTGFGVGATPAVAGPDTEAGRMLLSTGRIPTALDLANQSTGVAKAQLEGNEARALIPESAPTALAGQQGTQDKTFNDVADRVVADLYATNKKIPSPAEAARAGANDPRAGAFGSRINEPYYAGAIQRLKDKQYAQETARLNAVRERGGSELDQNLKIYQNNMTRAVTQLGQLKPPSGSDLAMASVVPKDGRPESPVVKAAKERVAAYNKQKQDLNDEISRIRANIDVLISGRITGLDPNAAPTQALAARRQAWDAAAAAVKANPGKYRGQTPEQVIGEARP